MKYAKGITKISLCCGILSSLVWQDTIERSVGHCTVSRDMTSRTRNVGSVSQTIFRALDKMAAGSGLGRDRVVWLSGGSISSQKEIHCLKGSVTIDYLNYVV